MAKLSVSTEFGELPEWNLADLYESVNSKQYLEDMRSCQDDANAFSKEYSGKLTGLVADNPDEFAAAIRAYEVIEERMGRIMSFAGLYYNGNTTDPERAKFYGDAQEKITNASSPLLFFTLEINRLDDDALDNAMEKSTALNHYRSWLVDLRLDKPYQLEDRIEQLFHEKSVTGRSAWNRLFDNNMASAQFNIGGKEIGVETALSLLQDKTREVRAEAATEIGRVLKSNEQTYTLITNTLAKDKEISDRWRGFEDVADSRHLTNRVEREVVDALVSAVQQSFPRLSHRYYAMKAKWLGLETMEHWDRNAPLPEAADRVFQWNEARDIVLTAYDGFAPEMANIAKRFFDENWIDAPTRPGKAPGAFSHPTVPSVHPYVMLNYLGKPRDVMTLAHELGHGVHQVLAGKQGALMSQTPLTLAETASVFGEMLTFRSLLKSSDNPESRKALLAQKVEDMLNTVVRQIAFYLFERKIHLVRREGELTSEQIGDIWLEVQAESLGDVFNFDDNYRSYWSYIPHFIHSPFYVYAYAFGDCLVNSLYAVYENSGDGFQEKYFEMLKAGGTKHHKELLAPFGLDASDPQFWFKGLGMIEGLIDELEGLDQQAS